ncbi:MAG: DUF1801 domain-containing protein [Granulosicoccus sp.]
MRDFANSAVEAVFSSYEEPYRAHLVGIREIILDTAEALELPDGIEEALKWGEPSYLPRKPRVGSTVRIGKFDEDSVALYFNCQTMLVESFRSLYGDDLVYSKNRAVLFRLGEPLPEKVITVCTRMALRYHLDKRSPP